MKQVDETMTIQQALKIDPELASILMESGMHCLGCPSARSETLEEACMVHGLDIEALIDDMNVYLEQTEM